MTTPNYNKGLSAPALCAIVLLLTIGLLIIETNERDVINDGTLIQIDVDDSTSESVDSGSDDEGFDIPAPNPADDSEHSEITEKAVKDTVLALSDIDFSKKVLWRIHRIDPLKGFSENDKNKVLFKAALQFFSNGDYKKSHTLIGKLPPSMRHKERPGFYYALALTKDGKTERAIRAYQGQLERFPHHQASAINYGLLLNEAKEYEKAIKAFKYAVNTTSGRRKAKSYRNLGTAYYELGQYEEAAKRFTKSIEYQPNNSTTWLNLAEAQQELPKYSQAEVLETYHKSVSLAPNRYKPALKRANYLFSQLMFAKAEEGYKEARKRSSDIVETALMQSINYLAAGNLERADKVASGIKQANNDEKQLIALIKALSDEDYDEAEELVEDIEKVKRFDNAELYQYLRLKLAVTQKNKQYLNKLDKDIFQHPVVGWPSQLEYARGLLMIEEHKKAQTIAEAIASKLPNSAEAHLINGQLQLHNGEEIAGFNSLKHAFNIYPESRRVAFIYAVENYKFERFKEAISIINKLLGNHPKDIEAIELKAQAHHAIGQNDLARAAYTEAFELDEKNLHSAFALAKLESDLGNKQQSLVILKDLLDRDSSYIDARELRAKILCDSRQYDECISEADKLLGLDKDNELAKQLVESHGDKVTPEAEPEDESESEKEENSDADSSKPDSDEKPKEDDPKKDDDKKDD
ncbi:tetratricopeptide repeat protein [Kangiella marina]|uniref:Tetratricopeptide repeat protein n=1 Tax=Kangiella marina TaxID=1079178 RepID=A0ABP8ICV5_9GAMM